MNFTFDQLISFAQISPEDMNQINQCRRDHNRLGFGYQLSFVKITNRFPAQQPLEMSEDILNYISVQLSMPVGLINLYKSRRQTISEHQERIRKYLNLKRYKDKEEVKLKAFLFEEACRLEQTSALLSRAEQFLKDKKILKPSDDTLQRLIGTQRKEARLYIFKKIAGSLSEDMRGKLDSLIETQGKRQSLFNELKKSPGQPTPKSMLKLTEKIKQIEEMGILDIDLSWLNNNFQRTLTRYAKRSDANRLRELETNHRYAVLTCFLWQLFKDTVDFSVDMFDKLVNKIYNAAQHDVDNHNKSQRKNIRESLKTYNSMIDLILDDSVQENSLREILFKEIGKEILMHQKETVERWLNGKHSHVFNLVKERFSYIRQFSPSLLEHIRLNFETGENSPLSEAVTTLRKMNEDNKRKLPDDVPIDFIPKKIRPLVEKDGVVDKASWECALLTAVRDEIKSGNISIGMSKRFGRLDDFFMPEEKWLEIKDGFFARAGLPNNPNDVKKYLTNRLNTAYDRFLENLPENSYARIEEDGWHFSVDSTEQLGTESKAHLESLKSWLSNNMRVVKLPELLIEVDNELKISRNFMAANKQECPNAEDIRSVLATIMAHGCNIGSYTMAHLIEGVSYSRIKNITDWMLTEETQRGALAQVVNAISRLDITQAWGQGRTSSSDGQRFSMRRRVLQQTYSPKFNDFALEFYSFVADNYAPFYSLPIECTDRDAPYILDGLLYNESDLPLEEHFSDTHGYTENNFAAFAMLARKYSPRIKGLHKQRIYRIDKDKDYQQLNSLLNRRDRTLNVDWVVDQWLRMGHFYASLECGHVTASTAMKRLNGYTGKNHFYRANRELGRIFKTEHILRYLSDKNMRQRIRRGLLKGEQIHALARDLNYGKRGRINKADLHEQRMSCSCMTLILACIIYWQAKEINRVILECDPEENNIELSLIEHISPIAWDNVILYGEYVLDKNLIRVGEKP
jgi:TnpA family transposase